MSDSIFFPSSTFRSSCLAVYSFLIFEEILREGLKQIKGLAVMLNKLERIVEAASYSEQYWCGRPTFGNPKFQNSWLTPWSIQAAVVFRNPLIFIQGIPSGDLIAY